MPTTTRVREFFLCSDGPESNPEVIATVLPRLDGVCSRARSLTWGVIAYSLSHFNLPFGVALENMRNGYCARVVGTSTEEETEDGDEAADVTPWFILQSFKTESGEWDYRFMALEPIEAGAAIDMKRDYLLPDGWYKVGEEVTLRNDFIASFCWEIAIPGDPSKIETANV